jgi:tetratricopeptide (TPR) repeat protein
MFGQSNSFRPPSTGTKREQTRGSAGLACVSRSFRRASVATRRATFGVVALALSACGAHGATRGAESALAATTTGAAAHAAPARSIDVSRTIVTPGDATSIDEMFAKARADFAESRFAEAAREFDRIVELDPGGPFAKEAWLHAAEAHDELGELPLAVTRYEEVARRYPGEPVSREALVRVVRLLSYLERWEGAGAAADALIGRIGELTPLERIVAYGGKALSLVFSEHPDAAQYFIEKGRDVVDGERLDSAGAVPRDLAQLYFALGELRRIRGERIHLPASSATFAQVLEERCQLLLDAQSAYSDAMRAYDAHWSAMAGYRVGELYRKLHEELMAVPKPPAASDQPKAELFEGAMRLRYSVLLRKGLTMMDHTLAMAEKAGERSEWVLRAAESKKLIERAMRDEGAALDRLPYSRADLEKALEDVGRRKAK